MTDRTFNIAVDVGGTFTDVVLADASGGVTFVKAPSTPDDQSKGVLEGLERLAERLGLTLQAMLQRTGRIVHGTTVATNALLERKGAAVALLATAGHRDVLEMREGLKPERYDLRLPRAAPLVPRHLRFGVEERIRADGRVETALREETLRPIAAKLVRLGVESVAVCYLHAYRDPRHELETRRVLETLVPGLHVSLSCDVLPVIKEFQRTSTTVVNAYVAPLIERYLRRLEERLGAAGFSGPLLVMLSHGGVAPVAEAVRVAAATVLSGPAGGVAGVRRLATTLAVADVVGLDMGGTSTDIALVVDGEAAVAADRSIANEAIALPSLDIVTLGAGGGSIATLDRGGIIQVGPESAGAVPGPVSYGAGGISATVTDANLVLGYLDPAAMSGRSVLDVDAARDALARVGEPLGLDPIQTAAGVHRIVNTQMAEGIRLATVRRGVDPRRFTLLGFGGAAGVHLTALARMLRLERAVVPTAASVLSAWGMLTSDLRLETSEAFLTPVDEADAGSLLAAYRRLEAAGRDKMSGWHDGEIVYSRIADMRYGEQIFEIDVSLDAVTLEADGAIAGIKQAFEQRHEALYTYCLADEQPLLVTLRVATEGRIGLTVGNTVAARAGSATESSRRIYLDEDWCDVPALSLAGLDGGREIAGPAVIDSETTTVLLRRGDRAQVDDRGWLQISIAD